MVTVVSGAGLGVGAADQRRRLDADLLSGVWSRTRLTKGAETR